MYVCMYVYVNKDEIVRIYVCMYVAELLLDRHITSGPSAELNLKTVKPASTNYYDNLPASGNEVRHFFSCMYCRCVCMLKLCRCRFSKLTLIKYVYVYE